MPAPLVFRTPSLDADAAAELHALARAAEEHGLDVHVLDADRPAPDGAVEIAAERVGLWNRPAGARVARLAPWGAGHDPEVAPPEAEAVWVPDERSRDALLDAGIAAERVTIVPTPIDVAAFGPDAEPLEIHEARTFRFLCVLEWTRRKGWDALLRAYVEEFAPDEDVTLVLHARPTHGRDQHDLAADLGRLLVDLGRDPESVPDILVQPATLPDEAVPGLYTAADCVVLASRGERFGRALLEAAACGRPIVAAAGGGGSGPVPAEVARETPGLAGRTWEEPDIAELRRRLRAAATVPPDAAAAVRRREEVVARHAPERVAEAVAAAVRRLDAADVPAPRPASAPAPGAVDPRDVSFVVQGPVVFDGPAATQHVCASIRVFFPGAEIVLSTWQDGRVLGLDVDTVTRSDDPGSLPWAANVNRQLVSSLAGVRDATRPYVVKLRTDTPFHSAALLGHWGRWPERPDELRVFDERVLVPNVFMRRPTYLSPLPLHPSDWSYFGTREDLLRLFDVPLVSPDAVAVPAVGSPLLPYFSNSVAVPTRVPEQHVWTSALAAAGHRVELRHAFDLTPESLRATEVGFAANFAVLDTYLQFGLSAPKYAEANRRFHDLTLYQHESWLELYDVHCRGEQDPDGAERVLDALRDGRPATHEDVTALRRGGRSWEAQLVESILTAPIQRDDTTGGLSVWRDQNLVALAREELGRSLVAA